MRKLLFAVAFGVAAMLGLSSGLHAAQPYSAAAFDDAQKAGKTVLLHVTAPWCPTCRAQHPIIAGIEKSKPNLVVFNVDYDTSKDLLKQLRVSSQSTLIVFKGSKEMARSSGDTKSAGIEALVAKGL